MRLLKQRYDSDAKDAKQLKLKNVQEDLDEAKQKMEKLQSYETKYENEYHRLKKEIAELELKKDNKKAFCETQQQKLKGEIERVHKELKLQ